MKITVEQLKDLYFFRDMFESHAESLQKIVESDYNEMATGFHLGITSNYLREHYHQIKELILNIENANRG